MLRPFTILIVSLAAVLALDCPAPADGCFVRDMRKENADLLEPLQKALIVFRDGREDLVLSVKFEGASREFGWIVPLPAPPEASAEDPALFEALSLATREPEVGRSEYSTVLEETAEKDAALPSAEFASGSGVEVLKESTVGIYRTAILRAGAGDSLATWLKANGFQAPPGSDRVFGRYIERGWVFAAMRITPRAATRKVQADLRSGMIQPIRFRFPADAPVFPLEVSALNPGSAEVLLYVIAPDALVPRDKQGTWKCEVFSSGRIERIALDHDEKEASGPLLPDDVSGLSLVKCRAVLSPESMKDVLFRPYEPSEGLASKVLAERLQALTHLGRTRPAGAARVVLDFLAGRPGREESATALWALGGIGGKEATAALLERACPGSGLRVEALDALRRLRVREALPLFVEGMDQEPGEKPWLDPEARLGLLCFDALLSVGDETCLDGLQKLARRRRSFDEWERAEDAEHSRVREDPARRVVMALAACGDEEAAGRIVDAIVKGSKATADDRVEASKLPALFWREMVGPHGYRGASVESYWPALGETLALLDDRRPLRDSILRRAERTTGLNDIARVILAANLEAPDENDLRMLDAIWSQAVRPPPRVIDVPRPDMGLGRSFKVRYNYRAVAVVQAFLGHKRDQDLLRLWEAAPPDDASLRWELVYALASSEDPSLAFPMYYKVQSGEGYWRIAEKVYGPGKGKYHEAIGRANGNVKLFPGQTVKVPAPPDAAPP